MKLKNIFVKFAILFTSTFILFIIINLIVLWMDTPYEKSIKLANVYSFEQLLKSKPNLARKIHPNLSTKDMLDLYQLSPNFVSHPTLDFMNTPVKNKVYSVGFENSRYSKLINQTNIKKNINNSTWVFGGSTIFGYGVTSENTIPSFLNSLDTSNRYINFGVLGFIQNQEIEKLILLLKKGYRPKKVIFFDGLNDIGQLSTMSYDPLETPAMPYLAYNLSFAPKNTSQRLKKIITALPIVEYMLQTKANNTKKIINENVYLPNSDYHSNPYYHLQKAMVTNFEHNSDFSKKVIKYYQANENLIKHLAKAYDFQYYIFFQPNGITFKKNPFIKNLYTYLNKSTFYKDTKFLFETVKKNIAQKTISNMIDISDLDKEIDYPYLDLTHYTAKMNKRIAQEMLKHCNPIKESK